MLAPYIVYFPINPLEVILKTSYLKPTEHPEHGGASCLYPYKPKITNILYSV